MKIFKFISKARFSYIDMAWVIVCFHLFREGLFLQGIAVLFSGAAGAVLFEMKVKRMEVKKKLENKDNEWKKLADDGRVIDAIKRYRSLYGSGLVEGKDAVMAYLDKGSRFRG